MIGKAEGRAAVLRQIHSLLQTGIVGDLTDGQLLEQFTKLRSESAHAAFKAIVERHGPMVWRVCRRVLTHSHDVEDAFQATFLVLAQHARSVRRKDSVASWLHGVAYRVACCARSAEARRKTHEQRYAKGKSQITFPDALPFTELSEQLDEELARLPQRYRAPLVLCDLEDLTHEQAALQLGWPVGTVKSRLSRGRDKLRSRLARRGLSPAPGAIGQRLQVRSFRSRCLRCWSIRQSIPLWA